MASDGREERPWAQRQRGGTREDRTLRSIAVSIPPKIADLDIVLGSELAADLEASAEDAASLVDAPRSSGFAAISRLRGAGVLRPLTDRKRDQAWGASQVLDELDDLNVRIVHAVR